ncbi:MAG: helix-turn-helix transcriptional regulator [Bacteroidales bacterium]|jgi:ribosome-binding protein aMBF1 (putative translation factor)|nr:helix-turn-helix transcriptional regulator [Bacteroidales bacterium]
MKANETTEPNNDIYDISAELAKEFGEIGSEKRQKAIEHAWEEYNAQILYEARKNAKMTQEALAKKMNVNKSYISRIERGLIIPTVATLYRLASAMGMSVELTPIEPQPNY